MTVEEQQKQAKELLVVNTQYVAKFEQLNNLMSEIKRLEEISKSVKSELEEVFKKHNIKKLSNEYISIAYIAPTESTSVDLKKLKADDEELYNSIMEKYSKTTKRNGYMRFALPK